MNSTGSKNNKSRAVTHCEIILSSFNWKKCTKYLKIVVIFFFKDRVKFEGDFL